jgi:hypothetical protein
MSSFGFLPDKSSKTTRTQCCHLAAGISSGFILIVLHDTLKQKHWL